MNNKQTFIDWFRASSPYVHAHNGKTFVIAFGGDVIADERFVDQLHDIALLKSLGVKIVLIFGAQQQIDARLKAEGLAIEQHHGIRITSASMMQCISEVLGRIRFDIEAMMSVGLANSPMAGAQIRITSGNMVTGKPLGIHNGIDYGLTGDVRRVDTAAIRNSLEESAIVLLPTLGFSPTGETFKLSATSMASTVASAIGADKLIYLGKFTDASKAFSTSVTTAEIQKILSKSNRFSQALKKTLTAAASACQQGVKRSHLVNSDLDGGLLQELFTRDGTGILITEERYDEIRPATIDDVPGLRELISPIEQGGALISRSDHTLEQDISNFIINIRDGMIIGCIAIQCYQQEQLAEIYSVAIHPDYRQEGRADRLLEESEKQAIAAGINTLFALTTQAKHWFLERGFKLANKQDLPAIKKDQYNYQRNSLVLTKTITRPS